MAPHISIENIADYVDQKVTIKGWLYNSTRKGKLIFSAPARWQRHDPRRCLSPRSWG